MIMWLMFSAERPAFTLVQVIGSSTASSRRLSARFSQWATTIDPCGVLYWCQLIWQTPDFSEPGSLRSSFYRRWNAIGLFVVQSLDHFICETRTLYPGVSLINLWRRSQQAPPGAKRWPPGRARASHLVLLRESRRRRRIPRPVCGKS